MNFALRMVRLRQRLHLAKPGRAAPPANLDAKELFASDSFADIWEDARMPEVLAYLKGNKSLEIPPEWRGLLPTAI